MRNTFFNKCSCVRVLVCLMIYAFAGTIPGFQNAHAQSNEGQEFIVTFLPNLNGPTTEVHLTSSVSTSVTVTYPMNNPTFTEVANITPGDVTIVTIPNNASLDWVADTIDNNAVRMVSNNSFIAYLANRAPATSDAGLALPVASFNREYVLLTNRSTFFGQFTVVAAYDNTTVTITPSRPMEGGHVAGTPFQVTLNRGEAYYGKEDGASATGLTGTIVSSNRPVGVTQGNYCSNYPMGACDHNFDSAIPVQAWGSEILAVNSPNRSMGAVYRIVTAQDNTEIFADGVSIATINRGDYHEITQTPDDFVISANNPIGVLQVQAGKSGGDPGQTGDPAISNLVPADQFQSSYTFSTLDDGQFPENWVVVIANNSDLGTIELDGATIGAGQFSPIGASNYSVARLAIAGGVHSTSSNNPHGIIVLGYAGSDSYQYIGGTRLEAINNDGDILAPICSINMLSGPPPSAEVTGTDNRPLQNVGGVDTEDTGVFQVNLLSGATNVEISVPSFIPGDGAVTAVLTLTDPELPGSGTVEFRDGAGNRCEAPVSFGQDPECEESSTVESKFSMDGGALVQRNFVYNLAQLLRQSGGTTRVVRRLRRNANEAYLSAWETVWTIPSTLLNSCQFPEFCEEVSLTANHDQYISDIRTLRRLARKTSRRVVSRNPALTRSVKSLRSRARSTYRSNLATLRTLPTSYMSCD